jgi:hypothetical protein
LERPSDLRQFIRPVRVVERRQRRRRQRPRDIASPPPTPAPRSLLTPTFTNTNRWVATTRQHQWPKKDLYRPRWKPRSVSPRWAATKLTPPPVGTRSGAGGGKTVSKASIGQPGPFPPLPVGKPRFQFSRESPVIPQTDHSQFIRSTRRRFQRTLHISFHAP